jgi:gas vesicle protein
MRWLMAIGLGAAAAYLLDPKSGDERRKQLRKNLDKAQKAGRKAKVQAGL